MTNVIEAIGIRKSFAKAKPLGEFLLHPFRQGELVHALRGVDLSVAEGEILGLLGPNGAGKTTLLKIFSCLILPNEGQALMAGIDTSHENQVKPLIGLVHADERSFYWRLTARENLRFFARLYNLPSRRIDSRIDELLKRVEMFEAADRPFSGYSSGMKQRIGIARALLHDPQILLMDEPTRSLDPAASLDLRAFILEKLKRRDGKTILLATHNLPEAEAVSDRIAILVKGRIRKMGTVAEIRRWGVEDRRFKLVLAHDAVLPQGPYRILLDLIEEGRRHVTLQLDESSSLNVLLEGLLAKGLTLGACDRVEPDLEDAFSRIIEQNEDDQ
jgi:ABC-2 type transport system ATP-binding protein